jgi:mannose-1-phosphate guanylyltransferase
MQAVVLAGGFGTRLRPLTYTRPKPLLPVANKPLLQHVLDAMPKAVDTVVVPVNYLREQIEAYFDENPDDRVVLVEEKDPLGTGGAIKNCQAHLTEPFLVYNGDIVASIDLTAFYDHMTKKGAKAGVSLWPVDEPWHFGVVKQAEDGRITRFVEKPPRGEQPSNLINAGHYYLDPSVLDRIEPGRKVSLESEVYEAMAASGEAIYGFPFEGFWVDCGRPATMLEAQRVYLEAHGKTRALGHGVDIHKSATVDGYALGDGCRIGAGARVTRSCLLPGVEAQDGTVVEDSILGEGVVIETGARLKDAVVGDFAVVEEGATITDRRIGMKVEHMKEA